jgi:threonine/homoserine/homoserine lactone efflux protein
MVNQIINAFLLGMVGGFIPGPILTMTFSETVRAGWRAGVKIILYALIVESLVAGFILLVFSFFNFNQEIFRYLSLAGGLLLFYFSYSLFLLKNISLEARVLLFSFKKIFFLTILNGGLFVFWITVCIPLAIALNKIVSGGLWFYLANFELGWLVAMFIVLALAIFARQWINNEKRLKIFFKLIAVCLALFGLKMVTSFFVL